MIFVMSGVGQKLNFSVVAAESRPASPGENTLWVKTSAMSTWCFSSLVPEAQEGLVWICTGSGGISFNALLSKSLLLRPTGCAVYSGGVWTACQAEIYQQGEWKALFYASVSVTYPEGAACVCSKGELSISAPDSSGSCVLALPEAGEWTVRVTDGIKSTEKTVSVTDIGQSLSVTLSFELYLVKAGVSPSALPHYPRVINGVYDDGEDGSLILTGSESAQIYCAMLPQVDLSEYKTMYVRASGTIYFYFGVGSDSALSREVKTTVNNAPGGELLSLDVSDLSGNYYAAAHGRLYGATTTIYDWWFE